MYIKYTVLKSNWEEDEVTYLRHRLVNSIRSNLHICLVTHSLQAVCEEEGVEGTAGDYFEMCRVTVKLLTRRRTQLKDFLSLFKGGMDTLLGDPTMTKRMLEVEKDTISAATVRKLKKYTESPKFVPDAVCVLPNGCPGDEGSCCSFVSLSPVDPVPSHPPIAHKPPTLR
ncbi:hypothetical protein Pcinc_015423 [Petrolisthes cinctipes]|uniref:Uncharacterized protein n=1 Tax=Petrolisthes cinctipes TaxID=88211 RepID=A0AAE1FTB4_PETCI|nr:hypothetical protein Pcinc_015423 [Petrolisthes cinctipes]